MPEPKTTKPSKSLAQHMKRFETEEACLDYLVSMRWPKGEVRCPRCNNGRVYKLGKPYRWQCKHCNKNGYRFSPLTKSIFENTNIPLRMWFAAVYLMCQSKKGISALQIHRLIGTGSYESAWYMCHRIRAAMQDEGFFNMSGVLEMDETYVGGKNKNRHGGGRGYMARTGRRQPLIDDKVPVIGAIARKGNVVCQVIERVNEATVGTFVDKVLSDKVELVATDDAKVYEHLSWPMPHETVNHSKGEYVRGVVHTANIDSFWSLLKRGIMGSFHHVSKRHLPLYLNEFSFRFNHRNNPDIFDTVIAGC